MAEVARYQFGPTRVIVMDDAYAGKTPEEIKAVIREASAVVARYAKIPELVAEQEKRVAKDAAGG